MHFKHYLSILVMFLGSYIWAQNIQVQGVVTDDTGEPLPGVNILVKGTKTGTVTDFDGKYKISVPKGSVLLFSYVGYADKEIKVTKPGVYNVVLKPTAESLEQVVITAMGIKKKEKSLGYSVQEVKAANLKTPETNIFSALQGELSGVQIQRSSGAAGAGVDILIRGMTSIDPSQSNQPLIVVDGIPVSNDIIYGDVLPSSGNANGVVSYQQFSFANRGIDLSSEDIQSITVLKGAAATALYGIKAANGAIIITTKKGTLGQPTFSFTSKITTSDVNKYSELQTLWREGYFGQPKITFDPNHPNIRNPQPRDYGPGKGVWIIHPNPNVTYSFHTWGPLYSEDDDPTIRFQDTYRQFFQTGLSYDNTFSARGGTEKYNYYFSINDIRTKGIVPYTNYDKTSFRVKADYQMSKKVNVELSSNYIYSNGKLPNNGDKSIMSSLAYWSTSVPLDRIWGPNGKSWNYTPYWIDNAHYFAYISGLKSEVNRFINGLRLKYDVNSKINIVYRAGVDTYTDARNRFVPPDLDVGTKVGGFVYNANIKFRQINSNLMVNYESDISKDLHFSGTLGNEILAWKRTYESVRGEGLLIPDFNNIKNTTNLFSTERTLKRRLVGLYTEMRFDYKERFFLNLTGRNDWTSTFSKENRSFFYPSASLAVVFHDWIDKNEETFSFGKIRLAYAEVGKDAYPGRLGRYFYFDNALPGNVVGTYISREEGDINARPERQYTKEIGFDLRFFNNKLRIDYTHYDMVNKDLLFRVPTPYSSGLVRIYRNVGTLHNWGDELTLSGYLISNDKFTWRTTVNYTSGKGKLVKLEEGIDQIVYAGSSAGVTNMLKEGDYTGTLYGWHWKYTENGERIIFSNGKPDIDWDNYDKVGNAFPDWVGSIGQHFSLGLVKFGFNVEYKKGGDVIDDFYRIAIRNGNAKITEDRYRDVVFDGVMEVNGTWVPNTQVTNLNEYWYRYSRFNRATEIMLEDASWMKLRNVYVSYTLPNKWLKKTFIKGVNVNLAASNFILWTKTRGFDPEGSQYAAGSNAYGIIGLSTPLTKNYSFSINVKF